MNRDLDYFIDLLRETSIGVKGFLIGQLKLFFLSFLIFSLGLYLIGVPYYGLIGFLIALVDVIPLVGSGIILLPWGIISIFQSHVKFGLRIILLYLVAVIVRQFLEPIIIGRNIGLRPLYTFASTLLGTIFFGPMGVFIGPIIAIVLNTIYLKESVRDLEEEARENEKFDQ